MKCSRPLLSLCMIMRNEENNLPRSLDSVQGLVDEMVIIDTGSEDNSVQIARNFGAQVYFLKWQKDFSLARNFALEKAQGQWILFLDADEELKLESLDLRGLLQQSDKEGYFLKVINLEDNGNHLYSPAFRLFRNNPQYRYEGKLHEQIIPSIRKINPFCILGWLPLEIYHYGYLAAQVKAKNKERRNLEILLEEAPEVKLTAFYCLNLGMEYMRIEDYSEAEKWFKEGWKKVEKRISFAHRLISKLVTCLFLQNKFKEAVYYSKEGEKYFPDYADLYYYHGISLMELGEFSEAGKILSLGLDKGESPPFYISEKGCGTYRNLEALGILEEIHLNFERAVNYFFEALRLQPHNSYYLELLLKNLVKCNFNPEEFFEKLNFINDECLQTGGEFLFNLGKYHLAEKFLELKKQKRIDFPEIFLRAKISLMLGDIDSCLVHLKRIPANHKLRKEAIFYIWIALWVKGEKVLAGDYLKEMDFYDAELGSFLELLHNFLIFGTVEKGNFSELIQENHLPYLFNIIEVFARLTGETSELWTKMVSLSQGIERESILTVIAKLLYKHKLYFQSYEILKNIKLKGLDRETLLIFIELTARYQQAKALKILNYILKQDPPLRFYLMGMDLWLGAAGKMNLEIQKKIVELKKSHPFVKKNRKKWGIFFMSNQTLSVCLIVKNEEKVIRRCLESIKDVADEIIIVDTGSTDATLELVKNYGAKIIRSSWFNDFSFSRNLALQEAQSQWILVLDADEELCKEDIPLLLQALNEPFEGYNLSLLSFIEKNNRCAYVTDYVCRLFKNNPAYRFKNRIHEEVYSSIADLKGAQAVANLEVRIFHYGYIKDGENQKEKHKRNVELLQLQLEECSAEDRPYYLYALGVEYFQAEQFEKGGELLKMALKSSSPFIFGFRSDCYLKLILSEIYLSKKCVYETFQQAFKEYPDFPDLYLLRGQFFLSLFRFTEALVDFDKCLPLALSPKYTSVAGVNSYRPWYFKGLCYYYLGNFGESERCFAQSLKLEPAFSLAKEALHKVQSFSSEEKFVLRIDFWMERSGIRPKHFYEQI